MQVSKSENEVDPILSRSGIFETPKDIDDLTICPTHRSNLGVGWSVKKSPAMVKAGVKSIRKADMRIGERVSQMVLKMSEKFIQPGSGK